MKSSELENLRSQARNQFWRLGKDGLSRLLEHAPTTLWTGKEQRFYRAEKDMVAEHVKPFVWGLTVWGVLFLTFRVTGSRWFAQLRNQYFVRPKPVSASNVRPETNQSWKSYLDQQAEQKQELFQESLTLPMDLLISFMCGCSSVVLLTDTTKLQKDFAEAPLLPGKSAIHKYMCQDMVDAFDNNQLVNPKAFMNYREDTTSADSVLLTFSTFVQNCKIRSAFIEQQALRGEQRFDVVPYPGLKGVSR